MRGAKGDTKRHWPDRLDRFVMRVVGGGDLRESPPGDRLSIDFGEIDGNRQMYYARTDNDGFEIWLGSPGVGWKAFYRMPDALTLARFILWDWWIVATWCGLRRKIWYSSLHRVVTRRASRAIRDE